MSNPNTIARNILELAVFMWALIMFPGTMVSILAGFVVIVAGMWAFGKLLAQEDKDE